MTPKNYKDLTGQTFNHFKVLSKIGTDHFGHVKWECECDCGRIVQRTTRVLKSGYAKHCGCHKYLYCHKNKAEKYEEIPIRRWKNCIREAESRNLNFDISIEFVWQLFLKQGRKCALSGKNLSFGRSAKDRTQTASLDRIDSSRGYCEDNVQWVHKTVNAMKMALPEEVFLDFVKSIYLTVLSSKG